MSTTMPATLVIEALNMAMKRRGDPSDVIHHSDQGSQYTSEQFKTRCKDLGVRISMGSDALSIATFCSYIEYKTSIA